MSEKRDTTDGARSKREQNQDNGKQQTDKGPLLQNLLVANHIEQRETCIAENQVREMAYHTPTSGAIHQQYGKHGEENHQPQDNLVALKGQFRQQTFFIHDYSWPTAS